MPSADIVAGHAREAERAGVAEQGRSIRAPSADLCLDFANTLSWRGRPTPAEALNGLADLLDWLARCGQATPAWMRAAQWSQRHPKRADRLFAEAIALRESIFRCALALAAGGDVPAADFTALNDALAAAPPRRCLVRDAPGYAWAADADTPSAPALLAPVLWSMADLLARPDQTIVRRCANDECQWLFFDRSKAGTRRWCDMGACGNRAKAQRHYRRQQSA